MTRQQLIKAFRDNQQILSERIKRSTKERIVCLEMEGWNVLYDYSACRFTHLTAIGDDCLFIRIRL